MLYEEIHDMEGDPISEWEIIIDRINKYRQGIQAETEAIITICQDYNEIILNG